MRSRKSWIGAVGLAVVVGIAGTSYGGHHPKNGANANGNQSSPTEQTEPPVEGKSPPASQPAVPTQFSQDEAAQAAAAVDLNAAQEKLKAVRDVALGKYEQTPEWVAAQSKMNGAQSDLDAAKKAASDALANNPDYQAALATKQKAVADLATGKQSGDATPETLGPLATASLQATLAVRKIEAQVQTNDTGVEAATKALAVAQHDADMLILKFQQGLYMNKGYAAANAAVEVAQKRYDEAHAKLLSETGNN